MPLVISDSSTLIHLAAIGWLTLLKDFYKKITIPPALWKEVVEEGKSRVGAVEVEKARQAGWIEVVSPEDKPLLRLLRRDLDVGISQAPEGRKIFSTLTVQENLNMGAYSRGNDKRGIEDARQRVFKLFPRIAERAGQVAGTLSGGKQQMLSIGRALMAKPKLLMLDEPSLGLAPMLVKAIFQTIREINQQGVTILLVEQNARAALKLANRGYVLETGRIALSGPAEELLCDPRVRKAYLGET